MVAVAPARTLVAALCSDPCAGRRTGTPGSALARRHIVDALRARGLDPVEQAAPRCDGVNVIATVKGDIDRRALVGEHGVRRTFRRRRAAQGLVRAIEGAVG